MWGLGRQGSKLLASDHKAVCVEGPETQGGREEGGRTGEDWTEGPALGCRR